MSHTVFESTNMRAVHYAERIFDCVCDEPIDNGTFGYFEEIADGYTHIYKFVKGTKAGCPVVVANNPAWTEDERLRTNQLRGNFFIPAGTPFRAFVLHNTDEFAVSIEGFSADTQAIVEAETNFPVNDVFVTIGDDGKLVAAAASVEGAVMEGRIERSRRCGAMLHTPVRSYGHEYKLYEIRVKALA